MARGDPNLYLDLLHTLCMTTVLFHRGLEQQFPAHVKVPSFSHDLCSPKCIFLVSVFAAWLCSSPLLGCVQGCARDSCSWYGTSLYSLILNNVLCFEGPLRPSSPLLAAPDVLVLPLICPAYQPPPKM